MLCFLIIYFGKRKPQKIQYISGNGNPEKFNIFRERETPKNSIYFGKRKPRKIQYISGNRTFLYFKKRKPWKTTYILGSNFLSSKTTLWKSFLYFGEWSFLAPSLKSSYISGGNLQRLKNQKFQTFCLLRELFKHKRKRKKFLKSFLYFRL